MTRNKTPQQLQVEQRQRVLSKEFPPPAIPQDLLEWLEGTYFATPLRSSDPAHIDAQLKNAGKIELVADLRLIYEEQKLENETDRAIAEAIQSPDTEVQF